MKNYFRVHKFRGILSSILFSLLSLLVSISILDAAFSLIDSASKTGLTIYSLITIMVCMVTASIMFLSFTIIAYQSVMMIRDNIHMNKVIKTV